MLNCIYRLIAPYSFEPVQVEVSTDGGMYAIVRPTYLSICNADMRYYLGNRSAEVLAKKLPMALIHEGIGEIVYDPSGTFSRGRKVVMLPNSPQERDPYISENYLRSSQFCGSGFDGFMQEYVVLPPSRIVELPEGIDDYVAAFTELTSVGMHAVSRFDSIAHNRRDRIGVWGDGNLGFIISLILRLKNPNASIVVFGRNMNKLSDFTFVDEVHLSYGIEGVAQVDHAFECCGGEGSSAAIDQIIDMIKPEGTISLLGVSENPVPINTRMVLEKGIRLFGSSRSGRNDFLATVSFYRDHPEVLSYLSALVGEVFTVSSIKDMTEAFAADIRKHAGKTIMAWNV